MDRALVADVLHSANEHPTGVAISETVEWILPVLDREAVARHEGKPRLDIFERELRMGRVLDGGADIARAARTFEDARNPAAGERPSFAASVASSRMRSGVTSTPSRR